MALFSTERVGIAGVCACVPVRVIDNEQPSAAYTSAEARKIIRATGIRQRRFVDDGVCASDLAASAARQLLREMEIDAGSIDLLIFLTQTPDYNGVPPTAPGLQHRLGLPRSAGAFDLIMNCSGFVYALSNAFAFAEAGLRVLLLAGDTLSRIVSPEDRTTSMLFGDAGAAVLVEKNARFGTSYFSLGSDGSEYDAIMIPAGGGRCPVTPEALTLRTFPDGSKRNELQLRMDGVRVYDFSQREVVPDIRGLLAYAETEVNQVDYWFFHQANRTMLEMFKLELGIEHGNVPLSLDRFGNTSTASIPLGMAADFGTGGAVSLGKSVLSAFGGGLSWGSCLLELKDCHMGKLQEYRP